MNILTEYLYTYYDEVDPIEFYRDLFNDDLQNKGKDNYNDHKLNAIAVEVTSEKGKNGKNKIIRHIVTNDMDRIQEMCNRNNFCLMSPISYVGKNRTSINAKVLYAIAIDLDGIRIVDNKPNGLIDLFHQIETVNRIPLPTYIVSSGTGLHLYYVFEKPIILFDNVVKQLQVFKKELTRIIWQDYITTLGDKIQYESLFQGFRVVGTITKKGERARAFITGSKIDMEYLNQFVDDKFKVKELKYKSELTLEEAKKKYPKWYQERIIDGRKKGYWICKPDLYYWWLNRIKSERKTGHRYYCMMCLAIYRRKSGISREQLESDSMDLLDLFDSLSDTETNRFTTKDIIDSLQAYDDSYMTYPINSIEYVSGLRIERNKRNYRPQAVHLMGARAIQEINNKFNGTDWRNKDGRPNKKDVILNWRKENPEGSKAECIRETGISKPTVYKWWNS